MLSLYTTLAIFWLSISLWRVQLEKAIVNTRCRAIFELEPGFTRVCVFFMSDFCVFMKSEGQMLEFGTNAVRYFLHHNLEIRKFRKKYLWQTDASKVWRVSVRVYFLSLLLELDPATVCTRIQNRGKNYREMDSTDW